MFYVSPTSLHRHLCSNLGLKLRVSLRNDEPSSKQSQCAGRNRFWTAPTLGMTRSAAWRRGGPVTRQRQWKTCAPEIADGRSPVLVTYLVSGGPPRGCLCIAVFVFLRWILALLRLVSSVTIFSGEAVPIFRKLETTALA